MENDDENNSPIYNLLISLLFTIISKLNDNSFFSLVLMKKNTPSKVLYISSLISSLLLNIISIIIGIIIKIFMNIDIINNYFLIIVFALYGFMSIISACQIFSLKEDNEKNKLVEKLYNNSSDEDSERPKLNIISKNDNNEMEIELNDLNSEENIDDNNNNLNNKNKNNEGKKNNLNFNLNDIINIQYSLIIIEIGEKIQIFNMSLSIKYDNWFCLILGNFFGNIIINGFSIIYGLIIIKKKINNIFLIFECIIYLIIAFYYIYLSFIKI